MLYKLKLLLGPEVAASDELLELLLEQAEEQVLNECNRDDIPPGLDTVVVSLAVIAYNKLGIEGEQSHSEGGVSRGFGSDDIPASLRRQMARYRLGTVRVL
jgi:hypothetical protein